MSIAEYLDLVYARLVELHGGMESPLEFREMIEEYVFDGKQPSRKDKGKASGRPRKARELKPDLKGIQELQARINAASGKGS